MKLGEICYVKLCTNNILEYIDVFLWLFININGKRDLWWIRLKVVNERNFEKKIE